jgi:hypothetical protein
MHVTLQSSTCFEQQHAHLQEDKLYRLCSMPDESRLSSLIRHTVQPFTDRDETRCCDIKICPTEDGHVDARNMSRIVR